MKRLKFIVLLFIVLAARPCFGAFTDSMTTRRTYKHAYRWTGKPKDKLLNWAKEVENRLTGATAVEFTFYSPTDSVPAANEGTLYYDLSESKLKYHNGSSYIAIESGSTGNSLDGAYDVGRSITVDAGVVTLTGTNAADNVVLALVQSDTGTTKGFTITNAGTGNTIDIQGQASSNDIEGTDDSWGISSIGTFTGVIGVWTGDQTFTGSTANILIDVSDDELLIEDAAVLSFGDAADVTITWNATNLLIEATTDNVGQIQLGATNSMDLKILGSTTSDIALFDASAGALLLDSYPIALGDGDSILFGDTLGTGDFSITDTSDVLVINNVVDGTGTVGFGAAGAGIDVAFHGDAGSATALWDENQNTNGAFVFNNADIEMGDGDLINFGDSDDFFMTATNQAMTMGTLTSDETSAWNFGADTDGDDLKFFGATTSEYWLWDASADSILPVCGNALYTMTDAEADQFKVNATGTVAGVAINFETTDGKVLINADGGTWGDIELNSADDIIFTTAGKLTITNGSEAMTVSGALTVEGATGLNGAVLGDGGDSLFGFLSEIEVEPATSETLTAADTGKVFSNTVGQTNTTFTLPAAAAGLTFTFCDVSATATQDVTIQADGDDTINGGPAAKAYECVTESVKQSTTLTAIDATQWIITAEIGTWANNNS